MTTAEPAMPHRESTGAEGWHPPLAVGQVLESELVFTPRNVRAFAALTHDINPLHHDAAFAAETRFGGLIASGTQTTGLLLGSLAQHIFPRSASLGLGCAFRLRKAVPADCTLTARWTVLALMPKPSLSGAIATLEGGLFDAAGLAYVEAEVTIAVMPHEALRRRREASEA